MGTQKYIGAGITPNAGARVVVHRAMDRPLPAEMGHDLKPNTVTSLATQMVYDLRS